MPRSLPRFARAAFLAPPRAANHAPLEHREANGGTLGLSLALACLLCPATARAEGLRWTPIKLSPTSRWALPDVSEVRGLELAMFDLSPRTVALKGAQAGLVVGAKRAAGLQAGILGVCGELHGMQIGLANLVDRDSVGAQVGGINAGRFIAFDTLERGVGRFTGVQLGVFNYMWEMHGAQIGVVNMCLGLHGLQLGLLNFARNSRLPVTVGMNLGFGP